MSSVLPCQVVNTAMAFYGMNDIDQMDINSLSSFVSGKRRVVLIVSDDRSDVESKDVVHPSHARAFR